jgi:hypothetical protein
LPVHNQDFQLYAGDSFTLSTTVYGDNVNLTLNTIVWVLKIEETSSTYLVRKGTDTGDITLTDQTHFTVDLKPKDTQNLCGTFYHECKCKDGNGDITTLFSGKAVIEKSFIDIFNH